MRAALVLLAALLLFGAGYAIGSRGPSSKVVSALRASAAASRQAAHEADSLRLADRLAYDAERTERADSVTRLKHRARGLGLAASRLIDTLIVAAPETCVVGLQRIQLAFALHLAADSAKDSAVTSLLLSDSLGLAGERVRADGLAAARDTAQNRLDRALALVRPSKFWLGAGLGVGATLLILRAVIH